MFLFILVQCVHELFPDQIHPRLGCWNLRVPGLHVARTDISACPTQRDLPRGFYSRG